MTKHFTRQKAFSPRFSEKKKRGFFSNTAASGVRGDTLSLGALDSVSVFETLRIYRKKIFRFEEHLSRLAESCRGIGRCLPLSRKKIHSWLKRVIGESGFEGAILRLSLHWEDGARGHAQALLRPFEHYPRSWYQKGVAMRTAVSRRWTLNAQDPQIKASQFVSGVMASLDGIKENMHEILFLGPAGTVAEGSVSNIFIVRGKTILTPCAASGILKGVTRGVVMDLAQKNGFEMAETFLTRHEIYSAQECFLTNTSSEILPVICVDGRSIGAGLPGPVTRRLAKYFKKMALP